MAHSLIKLFTIALLLLPLQAEAAFRYNSNTGTRDYCSTIRSEDGTVESSNCDEIRVSDDYLSDEGDYFLLRAGLASGDATSMTTSDTAMSTSFSLVRKAIASDPAFSTGTLANGQRGQIITILITEVESGGTYTLTPATTTGFTSLVFEAVGDLSTLLYVDDTVGWITLTRESVQTI